MRIKSNLDTILYDRILDSIIAGDFSMGETINISDLAQKYEVSRTPVVQAIKIMVNENILDSKSNGRVEIPVYELKDIEDICKVRLLIEQYAVREIFSAEETFKKTYERLTVIQKSCKECLKEKRYLDFSKTDLRFHKALVTGVGNNVLLDLFSRIQGRFTIANYLVLPLMKRNFNDTVDDHDILLKALYERDLDGALSCMEKHITKIAKIIEDNKILS